MCLVNSISKYVSCQMIFATCMHTFFNHCSLMGPQRKFWSCGYANHCSVQIGCWLRIFVSMVFRLNGENLEVMSLDFHSRIRQVMKYWDHVCDNKANELMCRLCNNSNSYFCYFLLRQGCFLISRKWFVELVMSLTFMKLFTLECT